MSFDIFLQRFENGESAKINREPVRRVLYSRNVTPPDKCGFYAVRFADGVEVEFSAKGLVREGDFDSCAFHFRGMSSQLVEFF